MNKLLKLGFGILILIIVVYFLNLSIVKEIFFTVFSSFAIAYAIKPLHIKLTERGLNHKLAAVFLIVTVGLAFIVLLATIVPSIFRESYNFTSVIIEIKTYLSKFQSNIKEIKMLNELMVKSEYIITNFVIRCFDSLLLIGEDIISLLVMPIIIYYFLADGNSITNGLLIFLPVNSRNTTRNIIKDVDNILSRYVVSQLILCALVGGATFIILFAYKIQFPVILSLLNAIFNIIPYFGPIFGAIPAIIIATLKSPSAGIWVLFWLFILQQIEGNIISPKVTGDSVNIHPLIVIILLVLGGKLGGFWGMVLAVPIAVIVKELYEDINYYLF